MSNTTISKEIRDPITQQFGAGIAMLENIIEQCTDGNFKDYPKLFHALFHTLLFLDYYLTLPPSDFKPPLPFSIKEKNERPVYAIGDAVPDRLFSQKELMQYLVSSEEKLNQCLKIFTESNFDIRFIEKDTSDPMDYSLFEILLYNMRHTQHHIGQLNRMLREIGLEPSVWRFRRLEDS